MKKYYQIWNALLLIGALATIASKTQAQGATDVSAHKVLMGGIVIGADTFPLGYIPPVFIVGKIDPARRAYIDNLRYNVTKVYPYAVTAAYVLKNVDEEMGMKKTKRERKAYVKATQKALNDRFKNELKDLTITQGKILVKLINRETGRDCYDVIKEMKGGLNARLSQTMAYFFDNDLKVQYDPYGEDRDIEMIVQEIEAKNYYQYQSRILEERAAISKGSQ